MKRNSYHHHHQMYDLRVLKIRHNAWPLQILWGSQKRSENETPGIYALPGKALFPQVFCSMDASQGPEGGR